jgi:hypothetical protein
MILGMGFRPKTNMMAGGWPSALMLVALVSSPRPSSADDKTDLIGRARAVETQQLKELAGKSFEMVSRGVLMDGKKRHDIATWRKIRYTSPPSLSWVRGEFDGQPVDEETLREKMAGKKKRMGADLLICVLMPLTDADISYLTPTEGGGARLYAVPHQKGGKVLSVQIEIDAAGRKRSATPRLGGEDFKYADKAEFTMKFAEDGSPLEYRSFVTGHFLWWSKSLEMGGHRAPWAACRRRVVRRLLVVPVGAGHRAAGTAGGRLRTRARSARHLVPHVDGDGHTADRRVPPPR